MTYGFVLLIFFPVLVLASPAEDPEERYTFLDKTHTLISTRLNYVANRLDAFFANERADDELGRSRIRIRTNARLRERARAKTDLEFRLNLRLPHLEERFKLEYFKEMEKERKQLEAQKVKKEALEISELDDKWKFRADAGANINIPPQLFTRTRLRKNFYGGSFIYRFVEEFSWFSDDGWIERTSIDTDYTIDEKILFRFINNKEWRITSKDFRTNHGPTVLQRVSDDEALSYNLIMSTLIDQGPWHVENYNLNVNYRRNLYDNWLFMDVIPGLDFPKEWSFRRTPYIFIQFEALFGG
jgi:hypothetical protein